MPGVRCPFCNQIMSLHSETLRTWRCNFYSNDLLRIANSPYLEISIFKCPNCSEQSIIANGENGYINDATVLIHPQASYRSFPDYVPQAIRSDYQEACAIIRQSPKAAATLARRCLQGMIHDFWNIHEKNLNAEITQLRDKIPASQWKAIDAIRSIGNIGAHMEQNVNLIVDVDPEEATKLVRLIEHLIEKWYMDRHDSEQLYADLAAISQEKAAARKR